MNSGFFPPQNFFILCLNFRSDTNSKFEFRNYHKFSMVKQFNASMFLNFTDQNKENKNNLIDCLFSMRNVSNSSIINSSFINNLLEKASKFFYFPYCISKIDTVQGFLMLIDNSQSIYLENCSWIGNIFFQSLFLINYFSFFELIDLLTILESSSIIITKSKWFNNTLQGLLYYRRCRKKLIQLI